MIARFFFISEARRAAERLLKTAVVWLTGLRAGLKVNTSPSHSGMGMPSWLPRKHAQFFSLMDPMDGCDIIRIRDV